MILRQPLGLLTPKVAHHIDRALWEGVAERARVNGYALPPDVVEFVADVRKLAEHYRRGVATDATDAGVSQITDAEPDRRMMLGVRDVVLLCGLTESGVRDAARRSRLTGQQVGGQWLFDRTDVTAWMAERKDEAS
jgi:Helix-turn-helix domain